MTAGATWRVFFELRLLVQNPAFASQIFQRKVSDSEPLESWIEDLQDAEMRRPLNLLKKKQKLNETDESNGNMDCDAPGSSSNGTSSPSPPGAMGADNPRRSLLFSPTSELADEAPNWFVSFFTAFEKRFEQKNRLHPGEKIE